MSEQIQNAPPIHGSRGPAPPLPEKPPSVAERTRLLRSSFRKEDGEKPKIPDKPLPPPKSSEYSNMNMNRPTNGSSSSGLGGGGGGGGGGGERSPSPPNNTNTITTNNQSNNHVQDSPLTITTKPPIVDKNAVIPPRQTSSGGSTVRISYILIYPIIFVA